MHPTGCNYMFWSLLLSVTVDVLVSTAEGEIKKKKAINTSSCYLSLPPTLPRSTNNPPVYSKPAIWLPCHL